jgi:hypothetical protein
VLFVDFDLCNGLYCVVLLQDGIDVISPHITKRKIVCTAQDFCNFFEGGLVSFTTLSKPCLDSLAALASGSVLCTYEFSPDDMVPTGDASVDGRPVGDRKHSFSLVCWRGIKNTLNVMCAKIDLDDVKHQFESLRIWR